MSVFEITIQRQTRDGWPVVVELIEEGELPERRESRLRLEDDWQTQLLQHQLDPRAYGTVLGRALFWDRIRDALMQALSSSQGDLRILLVIEDDELKRLRWGWLCAPIRLSGRWDLLALDQRVLFSRYLPSLTERRFPAIGRRDLRALVLVANLPEENRYNLDPFDAPATVASIEAALGEIPHDLLANDVEGALGPPTLDELAGRITGQHYTLLHIVAHGWFRSSDGETILYLLDAEGQIQPVTATRFLERLDQLQGVRGLPHFSFLATCESAAPEAEAVGALGGMAQRLVRELGMPAVVAMTQKVSLDTAQALASRFYVRLREHGEPDRALVEASAHLADQGDITVPALFSRLGSRPLFSDSADRELTDSEIGFELSQVERLLPERAPVLQEEFAAYARALRDVLGTDRRDLGQAAAREWDHAMIGVNAICEEVLDFDFRTLALGKQPPAYDGRCPFPGLVAFGTRSLPAEDGAHDDREFFFGREGLVRRVEDKLLSHNFLAVLGPSGSGKSSLVLAGLIPALGAREPGLRQAYLTPGGDPPAQLAASLDSSDGQPQILVVDQFEELFTHCADKDKRQSFLNHLLALVEEMPVVITMRADFWGDCAPYRDLVGLMQAHQELIAPMNAAELRGAMEQQAAAVGLRFEGDLANTILDDVQGEPGAMPLLQHALRQLWELRHGRWLKAAEYRTMGGVRQAIARTADALFHDRDLSPEDRDRVRDIFLRLTRLDEDVAEGEDWRDTRRRVALDELVPAGGDPELTRVLVSRLADARLLVTGENQVSGQADVEVAHEALIRHWPRLRDWLEEDREILRLREGIRRAGVEWEQHEGDAGYLVHSQERLEKAKALTRHPRSALNAQEQSYLDACVALEVEGVLLGLRAATEARAAAGPWLDRLGDESARAIIRQLEEADASDHSRRHQRSTLDRVAPLLGLPEATPDDPPAAEGRPVSWWAVAHADPHTRQTAALALSAAYGAGVTQRLDGALEAWAQEAQPGRWQRLWRKAEVWGNVAEAHPEIEGKLIRLGRRDRAAVRLWRVQRRLIRDWHRIRALTQGGAFGAGVALGVWRGLTAPLAGLTATLQLGMHIWWGAILGAALMFGMQLARVLSLDPPPTVDRPAGIGAALRHPHRLAVLLGALGFGLAHLLIALATGHFSLSGTGLVILGGFLAGLGVNLALTDQPWRVPGRRVGRWPIRLAVAASCAALGHVIALAGGNSASMAVAIPGDNYGSELTRYAWPWWQRLITQYPEWYRVAGVLDAMVVAAVLLIGVLAGARWSARRVSR